jgi:GT2 family glycosyltransferase
MTGASKVAAVVVTYNRRDLLLESLAAVLAQSRAPDSVIVVDNASEDGTAPVCNWPNSPATPAARAVSPPAWRSPWLTPRT